MVLWFYIYLKPDNYGLDVINLTGNVLPGIRLLIRAMKLKLSNETSRLLPHDMLDLLNIKQYYSLYWSIHL